MPARRRWMFVNANKFCGCWLRNSGRYAKPYHSPLHPDLSNTKEPYSERIDNVQLMPPATPQPSYLLRPRSSIPLLANVYCTTLSTFGPNTGESTALAGDVIIVRYADDIVMGSNNEPMLSVSFRNGRNACESSGWNYTRIKRA